METQAREDDQGKIVAEPARVEIGPAGVESFRPAQIDARPAGAADPSQPADDPLPALKLVRYQVGNSLDETQIAFLRTLAQDRRRNHVEASQAISYDAARGLLLALVEADRIDDWLEAVRGMDVRPRQVTVEAVLVVASLSSSADFGVRWLAGWQRGSGPLLGAGTIQLGGGSLAIQSGPFEMALRRAISEGAAEVLSRPSIGVVLGQEAKIESGRQVPVRQVDNLQGNAVAKVDFRDVSLSLVVSVSATSAGYLVRVAQRNDDVVGEVSLGDGTAPEIATQGVETSIELPSGHWVAAGSVVVDRSSASQSGILRDLPGQRSGTDHRSEIGLFVRVLDGLELAGPPVSMPPPAVADSAGSESPRRIQAQPVESGTELPSPALPSVEVRPAKKRKLFPLSK